MQLAYRPFSDAGGSADAPTFREIADLTDLEIAAFDLGRRTLAPLPTRGRYSQETWRLAVRDTAVTLTTAGRARLGSDGSAQATGTTSDVLAARRSWLTVLLAERKLGNDAEFLVLYLRADARALGEHVTSDGRHRFVATTAETALVEMAHFVMPCDGGAEGTGSDLDTVERVVSVQEWERLAPSTLGDSTAVSVVVALRNHLDSGDDESVDDRRLSTFVGQEATVVAIGRDGDLAVRPTTRPGLLDDLRSITHLGDGRA